MGSSYNSSKHDFTTKLHKPTTREGNYAPKLACSLVHQQLCEDYIFDPIYNDLLTWFVCLWFISLVFYAIDTSVTNHSANLFTGNCKEKPSTRNL